MNYVENETNFCSRNLEQSEEWLIWDGIDFALLRSNKNIAPPFKSPHKQSSLLAPLLLTVGAGRLELPRVAPYASETYAYTNSATRPFLFFIF